jgi:isoamylase
MQQYQSRPGHPLPLGSRITESGVQFSIFSRHAEGVALLLFDQAGDREPSAVFKLDPAHNRTGDIWHIHVAGLKAGQLYLYRMDGPFSPETGRRYDSSLMLLDPYAKALTGDKPWLKWKQELMPKCIVIDDEFDWEGDAPLNYPLHDCIIYETHLAGLTRHRSSGAAQPGTYTQVIELIPYFRKLGITSVEFLPVQEFNPHEIIRYNPYTGKRLTNYWGYSTVAFFAPAGHYAVSTEGGAQVNEFKTMVRELHKAGIEVVLDIVFNHTAEGNEEGPTFSFRGIDNSIYYILDESRKGYQNFSGCGNTMNCNHPIIRSFIIDCLHYWVMEMHVDGFRFDLGSILGRDHRGRLLENPPVVERIAQDPILRDTKLIAEAWDAAGTYQVGSFHHHRWAEWNDRFRDDVRKFWNGTPGMTAALAMRHSGSADLYHATGRKPFHSINYVTSHDGFTLNDLVSYEKKHNQANGENNWDGHDANFSCSFGIEGPSNDPELEQLRSRMVKNFLATLLLSAGTPMLLGGDEFRRTQGGNNNAYCQDNEVSWYDWSLADKHEDILGFTRSLTAFRRRHPVFRREEFYTGKDHDRDGVADITWHNESGGEMDWETSRNVLAVRIDGSPLELGAAGEREREKSGADEDFFLMFNAENEEVAFTLPAPPAGKVWLRKVDTGMKESFIAERKGNELSDAAEFTASPRSIAVLITADLERTE